MTDLSNPAAIVTESPSLFDFPAEPARSWPAVKPEWPHSQARWRLLGSAHGPSYWAALWADQDEPEPAPEPMSPEEEELFL